LSIDIPTKNQYQHTSTYRSDFHLPARSIATSQKTGTHTMKIATAIVIICILNFVAFGIGSAVLGGTADKESIGEGKYYVSNHGKKTEVTEQTWKYSRWHTRSLIVTHPLAMILFLLLGQKWQEKRKHQSKAITPPSNP
jgi:hypothetical protein